MPSHTRHPPRASCGRNAHFGLIALLATAFASGAAEERAPALVPFLDGELLVKVAHSPLSLQASRYHAEVGAQAIRSFTECGWGHVRLPEGMTVDEGIAAYHALPGSWPSNRTTRSDWPPGHRRRPSL